MLNMKYRVGNLDIVIDLREHELMSYHSPDQLTNIEAFLNSLQDYEHVFVRIVSNAQSENTDHDVS